MSTTRALATTLAAVALLAAASARAQDSETQVIERVVVVVNDEAVFLSEVRRRSVPFLQRAAQAPTELQREQAYREIYRQVTEHLIDEILIAQAARRAQVHVTREDVDRAARSVMRQNHLEEAQFWEAVRQAGFTEAGYREDVRRQITRLRLLNERLRGRVNITEEDVRAEYNHVLREARGQSSFVAEDILVPVPEGATATEIAEIRHQAESLRGEITGATWDEAMLEHGGIDLGTLHQGQLDPPLEEALIQLQPGQISAPVRNAAGFHLLHLRSRSAGAQDIAPYDEAKGAIYQRLLEHEMAREETTFIAELRRQATIVYRMQY